MLTFLQEQDMAKWTKIEIGDIVSDGDTQRCLAPALFPSELFERSSKRFSPFLSSLPLAASIFRSSRAVACFSPLAATLPFAVGALLTPIDVSPVGSRRFAAVRSTCRSRRRSSRSISGLPTYADLIRVSESRSGKLFSLNKAFAA